MESVKLVKVESEAIGDFARVMKVEISPLSRPSVGEKVQGLRINFDHNNVKNGLGQLVLTLVKLLHELLERQAIRRIDAGSLNNAEIERLGLTLMRQAQEIERLQKEFGLEDEDFNLDLGPLGKLI